MRSIIILLCIGFLVASLVTGWCDDNSSVNDKAVEIAKKALIQNGLKDIPERQTSVYDVKVVEFLDIPSLKNPKGEVKVPVKRVLVHIPTGKVVSISDDTAEIVFD